MTASDGIALAGIVLSIFSVYLTYRTGKEARDDAHQLATEARQAASADARHRRLFDRRKDVYEEVLEYVYRTEDTVDRTEPILTWEGAPGPPAWPTEEEFRRQNARIAAWGSPELRDNLLSLKVAVQNFQAAVMTFQSKRPAGTDTAEDRKEIQRTREAVKSLVIHLIELVNAELAR